MRSRRNWDWRGYVIATGTCSQHVRRRGTVFTRDSRGSRPTQSPDHTRRALTILYIELSCRFELRTACACMKRCHHRAGRRHSLELVWSVGGCSRMANDARKSCFVSAMGPCRWYLCYRRLYPWRDYLNVFIANRSGCVVCESYQESTRFTADCDGSFCSPLPISSHWEFSLNVPRSLLP